MGDYNGCWQAALGILLVYWLIFPVVFGDKWKDSFIKGLIIAPIVALVLAFCIYQGWITPR